MDGRVFGLTRAGKLLFVVQIAGASEISGVAYR